MKPNKVKQALAEGKTVYGCAFNTLRLPEVARILAAAGFDYTYIDAEHGNFGIESVQDIARAATDSGLVPLVRVADLQYSLVARALDNGAMGIIFPRVESRELLEKAVSWCRYPPVGVRGFGLTPSHVQYEPASVGEIAEHMNANTLVVLQIETALAVERREELLSVPGIDVVMIGPVDLSISLGVPADFHNQKMEDAIEKVRQSAEKHGIVPGIQTRPLELARHWKERGMRFIGCSAETGMLMEGAKAIVKGLRE
jgi:2-keto-3-deoxy-L-rhamnonate aldolase RhmA